MNLLAQSKPPGGFKLWLSQLQMKHGRKLVIALPYIWLILLFLLPFLIVFKISLAEMARAIPPYTELDGVGLDGATFPSLLISVIFCN